MRALTLTPLAAAAILTFSTIPPAHAYIDPGSLSVALQVVVAGIAGVFYAGRNSISQALSRLFRKKSPHRDAASSPAKRSR